MPHPSFFSGLARALQAGEQTLEKVVHRARQALGKKYRWLPELGKRYLENFSRPTRARHADVAAFLRHEQTLAEHIQKLNIANWLTEPQGMQPAAAAMHWDLPRIETVGALADWLSLSVGELAWFADLKALGCKTDDKPQLRHYRYRAFTKRSGDIRLIESPKPRLKALQRQILASILDCIPLHNSVHGFRPHHSTQTFARPHIGQDVVLRIDLMDFFPSISGVRLQTFFRTAGYPEAVADLLGGLCANAAPRDIWARYRNTLQPDLLQKAQAYYSRPHLPQGAPTSPAMANLCFYRVDFRLAGLAKSAGATYTRYADDLAFSGNVHFDRRIHRFAAHVAAIVAEEGFAVHHHKTRIMRKGVQQRLAGLVVNQHLNVSRADFDALKAALVNCIRLGPRDQNRDGHRDYRSHLQGRVAFVEAVNPAKGRRLRHLFDQIHWIY